MRLFDPTRALYWPSGGDVVERHAIEIGNRLHMTGRWLDDPAARLASLENDEAEARALSHDLMLPVIERALDELRGAMALAADWRRAAGIDRRAA